MTGQATSSGLVPTQLQTDLAGAAREFLAQHAEPSTKEPERSADPGLWRRVGAQMGWAGLVIDERHGGLGLTFADLCMVLEEAGRVLLGVPLADTAVCAAGLARFAPAGVADALLPALAAAERVGTVAFDADVTAEGAGARIRLSGDARFVIHGATADLLLLVASRKDEPVLLLVEGDALAAAARRPLTSTDRTRPLAGISFDGLEVPGSAVLAAGPRADEARTRLRALRALAQAAEGVGGADRALEMATAYAKERKQFGRVIGSFQAVKHKLASVVTVVEHARTLARHGAGCPPEDLGELARRAAIAKAYCGDAFLTAAGENIQVHGGIGFTWEHPAHLFYKRASVDADLVWSTLACREFIRRALFG